MIAAIEADRFSETPLHFVLVLGWTSRCVVAVDAKKGAMSFPRELFERKMRPTVLLLGERSNWTGLIPRLSLPQLLALAFAVVAAAACWKLYKRRLICPISMIFISILATGCNKCGEELRTARIEVLPSDQISICPVSPPKSENGAYFESAEFTLLHRGAHDITIQSMEKSCGCTTVEGVSIPAVLGPGSKATIKVTTAALMHHSVRRWVRLNTNSETQPYLLLVLDIPPLAVPPFFVSRLNTEVESLLEDQSTETTLHFETIEALNSMPWIETGHSENAGLQVVGITSESRVTSTAIRRNYSISVRFRVNQDSPKEMAIALCTRDGKSAGHMIVSATSKPQFFASPTLLAVDFSPRDRRPIERRVLLFWNRDEPPKSSIIDLAGVLPEWLKVISVQQASARSWTVTVRIDPAKVVNKANASLIMSLRQSSSKLLVPVSVVQCL